NEDAAKQELEAWAEIARPRESFPDEAPALFECIAALGSDELVRRVYDAFAAPPPDAPTRISPTYATLQGRATAPAFGAMCLRLDELDEAERVYREGLEWCERERCPIDAALCFVGLADIAQRRGDDNNEHISRARQLFERHNAKLYLDRLAVRQSS